MTRRPIGWLAAVVLALLGGACILQFEQGFFQSLSLHFALSQRLAQGEATLVHSLHYPSEVEIKRKFVRISGMLMAPAGTELPSSVVITNRFEDPAGGLRFRLSAKARVDDDGAFSVSRRLRKNIPADTLQMIFAEPRGADLAEGTKIWLCVDIVNKRSDLRSLPDCSAGEDDGGPGPQAGTTVVRVLDNSFDPKRVRVDPGDTVRWELAGAGLNHTVTAMDESVFDSGFLTTQGAFFEMRFTNAQNDQTFEYFCRTHHSCCAMQGSVQVGANAPDPGDGY